MLWEVNRICQLTAATVTTRVLLGFDVPSCQSTKGLLSFRNYTVVPLYLPDNTFKWAATIFQADKLADIRQTEK